MFSWLFSWNHNQFYARENFPIENCTPEDLRQQFSKMADASNMKVPEYYVLLKSRWKNASETYLLNTENIKMAKFEVPGINEWDVMTV